MALILAATATRAAAAPANPGPTDGPALPAAIPGYELRVLNERKAVLFGVGGQWIEASVPIFFYFPTSGAESLRLLKKARSDLAALESQGDGTAEDLGRIGGELDAAIHKLEETAAPKP